MLPLAVQLTLRRAEPCAGSAMAPSFRKLLSTTVLDRGSANHRRSTPQVGKHEGTNEQLGVNSLQLLTELQPEGNSCPSAARSMQNGVLKYTSVAPQKMIPQYIFETLQGE